VEGGEDMRPIKIIRDSINMSAEDLYRKLLEMGAKVWGVVAGQDQVEIYIYEDEESEDSVKSKLSEIKKNMIGGEGEAMVE
jgi:hypothetical protein